MREFPPLFGVESAVSLYRIAQESLRNALTHGGATEVVIEARITSTLFQLSVKDNGCGFVLGSVAPSGLGLSGMAERMKNVGGP
jgi:signal transduction histidine kinase